MSYGSYKKVFCRINAEDRQSDPSFGSGGFTMEVYVGPSIKHARLLATIEVTPDKSDDIHYEEAKLIINGKEIQL